MVPSGSTRHLPRLLLQHQNLLDTNKYQNILEQFACVGCGKPGALS